MDLITFKVRSHTSEERLLPSCLSVGVSVCQSVRMYRLGFQWTDFFKFDTGDFH